jgi:putative phosphoribosyl transferase
MDSANYSDDSRMAQNSRKVFFVGMSRPFVNRAEAGRLLAEAVAHYGNRDDVLVLALPRGGVPVAREIADLLRAPLDVFVVRKLGLPGREELGMGAIASGGIRVFNEQVLQVAGVDAETIEEVAARESIELDRRERRYRGDRPFPRIAGRTILLVDDGMATGVSMRAAVRAVRVKEPHAIVVAAPVASPDSVENLHREADDVVVLLQPDDLISIGRWYLDFGQVSDEEVRALLDQSSPPVRAEGA